MFTLRSSFLFSSSCSTYSAERVIQSQLIRLVISVIEDRGREGEWGSSLSSTSLVFISQLLLLFSFLLSFYVLFYLTSCRNILLLLLLYHVLLLLLWDQNCLHVTWELLLLLLFLLVVGGWCLEKFPPSTSLCMCVFALHVMKIISQKHNLHQVGVCFCVPRGRRKES